MMLPETTSSGVSAWQVISAIGGGTAAVVSLWRLGQDWWMRPRLDLVFVPRATDASSTDEMIVPNPEGTREAAYVRLRVVAPEHHAAADGVQVTVLGARALVARAGNPPIAKPRTIAIDGMVLRWSETSDGPEPVPKMTIPAGLDRRRVDLVRIDRLVASIGFSIGTAATSTQIEVRPEPGDRRHVVDAAKFEIELAVTAANARAQRFRVTVEFDGEWPSDDSNGIWNRVSLWGPVRIK